MQRFDCLARDCPLFGPHLLEASAGTGKTFAIEHIYTRLILESLEVEQILVVTFTRAATRELKARIRANLEKTVELLESGETGWEYLEAYSGSEKAIHCLTDALAGFDRCQIFTIHGFCYRMLKEFAFEAGVGAVSDPDQMKIPDRLKEAALDFLENGIKENLLCSEQLTSLLKDFSSIEAIIERLVRLEAPGLVRPFSELFDQCKAALHLINAPFGGAVDVEKLLEDFLSLEKGYKVGVKGKFERQVRALAHLDRPESLGALIEEKGTLFQFFSLENRKIKAQDPKLHYPGFFDLARTHLTPLLGEKVFPVLQSAFNPIAEKVLQEEEGFNHDEILMQMKKSVENKLFSKRIQEKYAAAMIDEFQDTDAIQWDIFQKLFLTESLRSLFLVGDPKQSIYRFRNADIYTYLKARDTLGESHVYHLDTNFRSSKSLLGALNALFSREWLQLPKINRSLPYHPVRAGSKIESSFPDQKGALHFLLSEGEPNALFEDVFLPFTAGEIETLKLENVAILVKDRYQAEKALEFLKKRGIAAIAKSHTPLGKTVGFQAVRELFDAVMSPRDQSLIKIVMANFAKPDLPFLELKVLLSEKGIVPFARKVLEGVVSSDISQVFEHLFIWEREEGFSFEGLKRFFKTYRYLNAEEGGRRRMEVDDKAVQIMTLHISKGLEFDVVFALGLASRTPESDEAEELNAEKLRQLYVAMTRAKRRLYVPIVQSKKETDLSAHSPMELFSRHFEGSFVDQISFLAKTESITIEKLVSPILLPPPVFSKVVEASLPVKGRPFNPSVLASFTTLAKTKEHETHPVQNDPLLFTLQTMPRGSETGVIIHKIFELVFSSKSPLWCDFQAIDHLVDEQLRFSSLLLWKEPIKQMVKDIISMPLKTEDESFCLADVDQFQTEMEFVFSVPPHFIKGFIDLAFCYRGKMYFLDWKSNWLENYSEESLQKAMQAHDYGLQAALYAESLKRHAKDYPFGAAFYIFVRGTASLCISNFDGLINDIRI